MSATIEAPQLAPVLVEDAMHRGVFTCRADSTGLTVARVMAAHRIHSVVVVDEDGACTALVTEADVAAAIHGGTIAQAAADIGTTPAVVEPQDSVLRAAQLMHEHERSHVVVVEQQSAKPVGVLSVLDLVDLLTADG